MKMNVTIIGTSIYYTFMKKFFGLSFVYRKFENELFKQLGSNWSFPRFTKKTNYQCCYNRNLET